MPSHWKPRSVFASDAGHLADLGATMYAPGQFRLDVSRDCSNPRYVEVSYTDQHRSKYRTWRGNVEYTVPCRKCPNCLRRRRKHWTRRIYTELGQADRSWFGTLTIEPEHQYLASLRAEQECLRRGVLWADMNGHERFNATVKAHSDDITAWLKRVRKNSGAMIRYCLVAEAHKSGWPHFHVIMHHRAVPVRHRTLKDAWRLGFSDFRLVEEKRSVARYVSKYLAKALGSRVRASARYGYNDLSHSPEGRGENSPPKTNASLAEETSDSVIAHSSARPGRADDCHIAIIEGKQYDYSSGKVCAQCGTPLERLWGHYDEAHSEGVPERRVGTERLSNEGPPCAAHSEGIPTETRPAVSVSGEENFPGPGAAIIAAGIWACPKGCVRDAPYPLRLALGLC